MNAIKNFSTLMLFGSTLLLSACIDVETDQSGNMDTAPELTVIDSLNEELVDLWNNQKIEDISKHFASDVTFVSSSDTWTGRGAVIERWVREDAPVVRNLKSEVTKREAGRDLMYMAGQYQHNVMQDDSITGPYKGRLTYVWSRQEDDSWKISFINVQRTEPPGREGANNEERKGKQEE